MSTGLPNLVNMILCDYTIVQKGTEKKSLIGIFNKVKHGALIQAHLYFTVSDMPRSCDFRVDFERMPETLDETHEKIFSIEIKHNKDVNLDKLQTYEFIIPFKVKFPKPGLYEIKLFANAELCGQRALRCT